MLTRLRWSPLVQGVVERNIHLLVDPPASVLPKKFSGLLAAHLRRGDFEDHCKKLSDWGSRYNGWNSFPDFPDRFDEPWNLKPETRLSVYLEHCYPTIDQIVPRLRKIRKEWQGTPLKRVYFLTNGKADFLDELERRLKADGWEQVHSTHELVIPNEAVEVDMAIDMMIGQTAEVFVGNGVSDNLSVSIVAHTDRLAHSSQASRPISIYSGEVRRPQPRAFASGSGPGQDKPLCSATVDVINSARWVRLHQALVRSSSMG